MEASLLGMLRLAILAASSCLFLLLAALLLVLLARRTAIWLSARAKARGESSRIVQVQLRLRSSAGALSLHTFNFAPVTVASYGTPDLLLPVSVGAAARKYGFRIVLQEAAEARALLISNFALLVNGVPRRQKELKPGDRIMFGSHRLEFQGAAVRNMAPCLPARPAFAWQLPGIAALLFFAVLFFQTVKAKIVEPPLRAFVAEVPEPVAGEPEPVAEAPEAKREPPAEAPEAKREPAAPVAAKPKPPPPLGQVEVQLVAPGEDIECSPVDILFFHAHPDDESLAFGAMMAAASRSGKRLATVLFTDGEAGKDLYPRRAVGGMYPDRELRGSELAEVRVREACAALAILGCPVYVRLGLPNRPYNGLKDEVSPEEVVAGWGGEAELVARLERILRALRPRIVVSPDAGSGARGHFEHGAVGIVVAKAVASLRGEEFLRGHLVPVDPLNREQYPLLVEVDGLARDGKSGLSFRQIQCLALRAHVSQRDASVVGIRLLARRSRECYRSLDWELGETLTEYLARPPEQERTAAF